ncbi:MAG: hypothetical protein PHH54_03785 [Candidatus Nanoarchaeia archaeon]|nr:hypothetical protein [Candidatus Nanoarchaeia archaeon]MDD5741080.1 hypothetical protein [Candidatus Nanoarchaeia archaeon]
MDFEYLAKKITSKYRPKGDSRDYILEDIGCTLDSLGIGELIDSLSRKFDKFRLRRKKKQFGPMFKKHETLYAASRNVVGHEEVVEKKEDEFGFKNFHRHQIPVCEVDPLVYQRFNTKFWRKFGQINELEDKLGMNRTDMNYIIDKYKIHC